PPFARMARIIVREQDADKLHRHAEKLAAQLAEAITADAASRTGAEVKMKGPMPCAISRIAGYFRHQIVLQSASAESLQRVLAAVRERGDLAASKLTSVDVDPVSLL